MKHLHAQMLLNESLSRGPILGFHCCTSISFDYCVLMGKTASSVIAHRGQHHIPDNKFRVTSVHLKCASQFWAGLQISPKNCWVLSLWC